MFAVVSNAPSFLTTRVETDKFPGSCDVRQCVVRDEIICGILSDRSCVDLYKLGPIAASDRGSTVYKSTEIGSLWLAFETLW